jgi:acylphosphatase
MPAARRIVVTGRVQGVGFRFFALDAARREGLVGWVRNLADGSVEAEAEGDADSLDRFEMAMRRGPPRSRVEDVIVESIAPTGRRGDFIAQ